MRNVSLGIGTGITKIGWGGGAASGMQFVGPTGVEMTASVGTVTTKNFQSITITGNAATVSVGTVTVFLASAPTLVSVTGNSMTASVGTVTVIAVGGGVFTDDFNRADQLLTDSANWSLLGGSLDGGVQIRSNQISSISGPAAGCWGCPDVGSADHYVQVKVLHKQANPGIFACCRLGDFDHYVGMIVNTGTGDLEVWRKNGSWTNLAQGITGGTITVGTDVIRLECVGTKWGVYKNGILLMSGNIGDAALTSTRNGLVSTSVGEDPCYDDFECGPCSTVFP